MVLNSWCACDRSLASGEVGLDADNARAQALVDAEVLAVEKAGHWGADDGNDDAQAAARQKTHDRFSKLGGRGHGGKVGQQPWVEDKNWWKDHAEHLDGSHKESTRDKVHSMTPEELKTRKKMRQDERKRKNKLAKLCGRSPDDPLCRPGAPAMDLAAIQERLANHYDHEATGAGKESFVTPEEGVGQGGDPREEGKRKDPKDKHKDKHKHKHKEKHEDENKDEHKHRDKHKDKHKHKHTHAPTRTPTGAETDGRDRDDGHTPADGTGDAVATDPDTAEPLGKGAGTASPADEADGMAHNDEPMPATVDGPDPEEGAGSVENADKAVEDVTKVSFSRESPEKEPEEEKGMASAGEVVEDSATDAGAATASGDVTTSNANDEVSHEEGEEGEQHPNGVLEENQKEESMRTISNTFTVLQQTSHDESSFTQGLSYGADGTLFETSGLYGQSKVRRINPDTFAVELSVDLANKYFGEGCAFYTDGDGHGRVIHITWRKRTGFIYDAETLQTLSQFEYTTGAGNQGWGITYDAAAEEFVVSDGSAFLYFWDRDTLAEKRRIAVTRLDGRPQDQLNELEFMDGLVCCNIWHWDEIICVDPTTGKSAREYDMSSLWPASKRGNSENVLNGIALGKDHVLLTGKKWDRMYKVDFPDWPTLFGN